jgi:hypothetical protein
MPSAVLLSVSTITSSTESVGPSSRESPLEKSVVAAIGERNILAAVPPTHARVNLFGRRHPRVEASTRKEAHMYIGSGLLLLIVIVVLLIWLL